MMSRNLGLGQGWGGGIWRVVEIGARDLSRRQGGVTIINCPMNEHAQFFLFPDSQSKRYEFHPDMGN